MYNSSAMWIYLHINAGGRQFSICICSHYELSEQQQSAQYC